MGEMTDLPADLVSGAIEHMNADHGQNLLDYARAFGGLDAAESAEMTGLDASGFDMTVAVDGRLRELRIDFAKPLERPEQLRAELVRMAKQARAALEP